MEETESDEADPTWYPVGNMSDVPNMNTIGHDYQQLNKDTGKDYLNTRYLQNAYTHNFPPIL